MGENEQGGMLRVVVVLGLIALIAGVIVGGVAFADQKMNAAIMKPMNALSKASATNVFDAYKEKIVMQPDLKVTTPYDNIDPVYVGRAWYVIPGGVLQPGDWDEVRFDVTPNNDANVYTDINTYKATELESDDQDSLADREMTISEGDHLIADKHGFNAVIEQTSLKAGHTYTIDIKWHNGTSDVLYEAPFDGYNHPTYGSTALKLDDPVNHLGSYHFSNEYRARYTDDDVALFK